MSNDYLEILEDAKMDRLSGASVVARKAIKCIQALMKQKSGGDIGEIVSEVERITAEILKSQPRMAQLTNFFNTVFNTVDEAEAEDVVVLLRKLSGKVRLFEEQCTSAVARVAELGAELIEEDSQVFIHSNSSTILEILKTASRSGKTFEVLLTESRPVMEGRAAALEFVKMGIPCTYFVDAAAVKGVDRADLVLLGADTVSEVSLVNKIGTKAICLLARESVVPCYAACESSKFIPKALSSRKEKPRPPGEVWNNPPGETSVENYYFDDVSLQLFNGIIMEEAILTPEEIGGRVLAQKMNKRLLTILR